MASSTAATMLSCMRSVADFSMTLPKPRAGSRVKLGALACRQKRPLLKNQERPLHAVKKRESILATMPVAITVPVATAIAVPLALTP